jgi:hypothetical protein
MSGIIPLCDARARNQCFRAAQIYLPRGPERHPNQVCLRCGICVLIWLYESFAVFACRPYRFGSGTLHLCDR